MPEDLPLNIATYGGHVDGVIRFIYWIVGAWLVATEAVLVYLVVRYRRRPGVRASWNPAETLRSQAWVLVPVVLVTICDLAIEAQSATVWDEIKVERPPHDVLVRVTARQYAWSFTYAGADGNLGTEDDFSTVTQMLVPARKVVRFQLESLDVLHSFWVPALRLKQDVVPGRSIPGWFEATRTGDYEIACAELCGPSHSAMRARLKVVSAARFSRWAAALAEQQRL